MYLVGIAPGLTGAVAVLALDGTLEALADTPTLMLKVQRGTRQAYDVPGMAALLRPYAGLHAMSHRRVATDARTGDPLDVHHWLRLRALARDADDVTAPVYSVRPGVWKRALALGKDKEASRLRAMQLYPGADLRRKKHHGRAEALLLASYGLAGNWRNAKGVVHGLGTAGNKALLLPQCPARSPRDANLHRRWHVRHAGGRARC